jgi:archaetidylinositol phosphate synthase
MLTKLKQRIQSALATEARLAHEAGLTPNAITVIGMVLALLSAVAYASWGYGWFFLLIAIVMLLFSGLCDALDGVVARLYGQTTELGGFLDSVLDRYADAAVYVGILIGGLWDSRYWGMYWVVLATIGSLLVSYIRARAEAAGIKMESIGLAERAERMLILIAASLVALFLQPATIMTFTMIVLTIITNFTVLQRGFYVYAKLKKKVAD